MVLLLCVSGISVLGWHAGGTGSIPTVGTFFFSFALRLCAGSANGRSPVQMHLGTKGTFFFLTFFFMCMVGRGTGYS